MNGFLRNDFNKTGRAGIIIDIGKSKKPGMSRTIEIDHDNNKGRNLDMRGSRNTTRGLRFRNIRSGDNSKKDKESIEVEKAGRIEVEKAESTKVKKAGNRQFCY